MSRVPRMSRSWSLATGLLALVAWGGAGCSSYDLSRGPAAEADDDWEELTGGDSGGNDQDESPPDDGDEPADGADDDGGSLPPVPDDDGVDNGTESDEVCDYGHDVSLQLSPDDSNSSSSPVQAREAVLDEQGSVEGIAIRTWEFFNYYDLGYPAAEPGTLGIHPSLLDDAVEPGSFLLQIGISSEALTEARPPVDLTLVLDTSTSMAGEPMEMLVESCRAIAASLSEGDTISIVTWGTDDARVLEGLAVQGPDDPELLAAIEGLETGGSTDLHSGLVAGYELAAQAFEPGRTNRVVLVSDGGANPGLTDIELIAEHASGPDHEGIDLVGVGVGEALGYHDELMEIVTDAGQGASVFIPSADEAWRVFHEGFTSTFAVVARDVRVRLDLPPGFEIVSTTTEEASLDVAEVDPQSLAPNDAMVFHQRIRTCAPELLTEQSMMTVTVSYRDALSFEAREVQHGVPILELLQGDPAPLLKGAALFAYAESLKLYKQADLAGRPMAMDGALAAIERAEAALPGDPELAEIRAVLEALAQI